MFDTSDDLYRLYLKERKSRYLYLKEKGLPIGFRYFNSDDYFWGSYNFRGKFFNGYEFSEEEWKELTKVYRSSYQRRRVLKERVLKMQIYYCYFVTLTFNDDILNSSNPDTRKKYVNRFLNKINCVYYIAVREFGKRTNREHYHLVICFNRPLCGVRKELKYRWVLKDTIIEKEWEYGLVDVVYVDTDGSIKTSCYLAKTSGYICKDTNKKSRVIYSRNFKNNNGWIPLKNIPDDFPFEVSPLTLYN